MESYIIKASITIFLFHLFFQFVLRKNTPFWLTRWYFIAALIISLTIPLVSIPYLGEYAKSLDIAITTIELEEVIITPNHSKPISLVKILSIIYISGAVFFVLRFLVKISTVLYFYLKGSKQLMGKYRLVIYKNCSPFTFFNFIFLSETDRKNDSEKMLLKHEMAHSDGKHAIDNLIFELMCILFWFHPSVWIMRKEAINNHEYLADAAVLKEGYCTRNYQETLLAYSLRTSPAMLGNSFNSLLTTGKSEVIKRMKMMLIDKNQFKRNKLIYSAGFIIAISTAILMINSCNTDKHPGDVSQPVEKNTAANDQLSKSDVGQLVQRTELEDKEDCRPKVADEVFFVVEDMPKFQGKGVKAFRNYIAKNVNYPKEAKDKGISGKVFVQFAVDINGKTTDVKIVRGVDPLLDNEVLRVVSSSPIWEPGIQRGQKVKVQYTVPVDFKLN
ncbi:MAG: M56 family metallopeptidase [Bacteroidales bacterium]|nr:M56 family metallopeptidase [Bacteroidales bacterium]